MMVPTEEFHLDIVANLVNQFYLQKRFSAYEVPDDALLLELLFMVQYIVDGLPCHFPRHPLLRVLPHQVTILAG